MTRPYSRLISKLAAINDRYKRLIVNAGAVKKVFYLIVLIILKTTYTVVSLPFFLFVQPKSATKNSLQNVTASPQRLQQALILSIIGFVTLIVATHSLFDSFAGTRQATHGASSSVTQLNGTRPYQSDVQLAIKSVEVSPFDSSITFRGTGPSYGHTAIFVDNGESFVANVQINAQGVWEFVHPLEQGTLKTGQHSVFTIAYGDDNQMLGTPSTVKTFDVPSGTLPVFFHYIGLDAIIILLTIGVLWLTVVKLKKTVRV